MKKVFLLMLVSCLMILRTFAQPETEKKLGIKELPTDFFQASARTTGALDCKCNNSLFKDPGFATVTITGSDINAGSPVWKVGSKTPQYSSTMGGCDNGFVTMWGNKTVGEAIYQSGLNIGLNKKYVLKFSARFINQTGPNNSFVKLAIKGSASASGPHTGSPTAESLLPITSTAWATYSIPFTSPANFTALSLYPINGNSQNDGAYVSWIQIDNVCLQEECKVPDEKCDPKFTAAPFTVNAQGNIVINVNPVITAGATHYWGLLGANSLSDNAAIPLATILAGGSFGLGVNSNGLATPIGMGTGINGSSSGYGYHYEGVSFGSCFKITHYIKCCSNWYTQTNTYCSKFCSEVKESGLMEVPAKEAERLEAILSNSGRG